MRSVFIRSEEEVPRSRRVVFVFSMGRASCFARARFERAFLGLLGILIWCTCGLGRYRDSFAMTYICRSIVIGNVIVRSWVNKRSAHKLKFVGRRILASSAI